jgi:hypothetical protein
MTPKRLGIVRSKKSLKRPARAAAGSFTTGRSMRIE